MRTTWFLSTLLAVAAAAAPPALAQTPAADQAPAAAQTRRMTIDDAVRSALENNLGIRVARFDPQVQDLSLARALAAWTPTFTSTIQNASTDSPNNSFLSGGGQRTSDDRLDTNVGLTQNLPWGGSYSVGWDSSRSTTSNVFSNFSPQLRSSVALSYTQPLLRGFGIDQARQDVLVSRINREISDLSVRQTVAATSRTVRNAYYDLVFAIASLEVQRQSLELAQESLRNTRARVEIGTTPPIDVVEAEAEVATREEAVIVGEAQIQTAEDALRALVLDPDMPDFWTVRIEPADTAPFAPAPVDTDGMVRTALQRRTDLLQTRKTIESNDVGLRYLRNETLPDVTASFDYGLTGLGGTQLVRGEGFPGPVIGQSQRSFGAVLGDVFANDFPNWTAAVNISYPLGNDQRHASLARARVEQGQRAANLRSQELQVATDVREAARQATTNQRRVETTRVSRQLAERRLEAEQRKLAAGTSTSFVVFQVQRDLAQAQNNELRAILDFNRSVVDLETVQEAPLAPAAVR